MTRTAVAANDPPGPEQALPRRFQVANQALIGRPRVTVWEEYAELHHPAWAETPEHLSTAQQVGDARGLVVGAGTMSMVPAGADGVRAISYSRVTEVHPGYSVANETIWTGAFELRETIQFFDHPSGGTHVSLVYWVDTAPITPTRAQRLQHNLGRIQRGFLDRATAWRPGTPHKPNIIAPEAQDLP